MAPKALINTALVLTFLIISPFQVISEAPHGLIEGNWIEYGADEDDSYNWKISDTFIVPTEQTNFDAQTRDNCSNGIHASYDTGYATGLINDNYALRFNYTGSGSSYLSDTSSTGIWTMAAKIRLYSSGTLENAGRLQFVWVFTDGSQLWVYWDCAKTYMSIRIRWKNPDTSTYKLFEQKQHDIADNVQLRMASFNNITGEMVIRINNRVQNYTIPFYPTAPINYIMYEFAQNKVCGFYADDLFRWNRSFNKTELSDSIPVGLKLAYPPNNKDWGYAPVIHTDSMTANMTQALFNVWNKYNIKGCPALWISQSTNGPLKEDTIDYSYDGFIFSEYLKEQIANGHEIGTHGLIGVSKERDYLLENFTEWKNLLGDYPRIWVDHSALEQNIEHKGANASSDYYINDFLEENGVWKWPNLADVSNEIGYPDWAVANPGYYWDAINCFNGNATFEYLGIEDLFSTIASVSSSQFWNDPTNGKYIDVSTKRPLILEHNYPNKLVYLKMPDTNYSWYWTTQFPEMVLTLYSTDPNLNTNYHYYDDIGTWMAYPRYDWLLENWTTDYDLYSEKASSMLDRAAIYGAITTYFEDDSITIQNNATASLFNGTIFSNENSFEGMSLLSDDKYYCFIPSSATGHGSTIDEIGVGTNEYGVVSAPISILGNNSAKLGRIVYDSDAKLINVGVNRNGTVHLSIPGTWTSTKIQVYDRTNNTLVNWTEGSVEFIGVRDHEYIILEMGPSFTYTTSGRNAVFTDASVGYNLTYFWDFGDGSNSTTQNPSHTYSSYGTYDVTLTVTDEYGATNSTTQTITLQSPAEQATEDIDALVPVMIAATGVVVVLAVISNGVFRPFSRIFRRIS
jgi:hypothetical protein